jgi:hypothetical protein
MRRLLAILLIALLAAPASAARFVGTWVYSSATTPTDASRVLRLKIRDASGVGWGTSVGTGYSPYLEIKKAGVDTLFATISGTWSDSTQSDALFALGAVSALRPTIEYQDYEGYLVLTNVW